MHHKCIFDGLSILPRQHILIAKKMPVGSIREWTWRERHCLFLTLLFLLESALGFDFRRRANVPLHLLWRGSQTKGIYLIFSNMCRCQHVTCDQQWTLLQLTPITVKLWSRLLLTRIGRRRVLKRCLSLAPLVHLSNEMWTLELKSLNILLVMLNGKLL